MVSYPSCHQMVGKSWETPPGKKKHRILLAVPAPIGTRGALGAARLNLVQKGLALELKTFWKECLFTKTNPVLWFSMFAYKNKLLSLCFARKSFSSTIKKTIKPFSLRDPYEDRQSGFLTRVYVATCPQLFKTPCWFIPTWQLRLCFIPRQGFKQRILDSQTSLEVRLVCGLKLETTDVA